MSAWIWVQNSVDLFDHDKILKFAKFNPRENVSHPQFAKYSTRESKVFYSILYFVGKIENFWKPAISSHE